MKAVYSAGAILGRKPEKSNNLNTDFKPLEAGIRATQNSMGIDVKMWHFFSPRDAKHLRNSAESEGRPECSTTRTDDDRPTFAGPGQALGGFLVRVEQRRGKGKNRECLILALLWYNSVCK